LIYGSMGYKKLIKAGLTKTGRKNLDCLDLTQFLKARFLNWQKLEDPNRTLG